MNALMFEVHRSGVSITMMTFFAGLLTFALALEVLQGHRQHLIWNGVVGRYIKSWDSALLLFRGESCFLDTMVGERIFLLTVTCSVLMLLVRCDEVLQIRSPEEDKAQEEKELIEALQEVLEKLRNKQIPAVEKKLGWVPSCDAGEQCAVRKGSRFGKLCSCPGGTACSFSILKCL
ncbi:niq CART3-like [Danio rerio]|uniref:Niq CART3-like n=2 Tax=Danio rerio TaxID=7955 RepID=A0A8N7T617_DANRE